MALWSALSCALISGIIYPAYAADLSASLVPQRDRAEASYIGVKVVTLTYAADSSLAEELNGKYERVQFTLDGTASIQDETGMTELINAVNRAYIEAQSPVQIEHAKIKYTAVLKGGPDSTLISYKLDLEPTIEEYLIDADSSGDFIDLQWRGIVIRDPLVVNPQEVTATPADLQVGEIDINYPIGLLQAIHPSIAGKLANTKASELLNDPIANFEDFRYPMTNWHFLFDPVGTSGDGKVVSVFSLGESTLREGGYSETEKDSTVTIDGARIDIHSTTPPPSGQITTEGFAMIQGSPGAEFAIVTERPPDDINTGEGNADEKTVGLSSFLDGNSYVIITKSSNVTALLFTIKPHDSIAIDVARGQTGELELTLPKKLIDDIHTVRSSDDEEIPFQQVSLTTTTTTIKFTVPASADSIEILGASVVPEFPISLIAMGVAFGIITVLAIRKP